MQLSGLLSLIFALLSDNRPFLVTSSSKVLNKLLTKKIKT